MSKRTGRKPKRERTSRRRTRRHSSTSESSEEDVPPKPTKTTKTGRTRASSRVDEAERKIAFTIKVPKSEVNDCNEENSSGMWKVECSNGSDGDIQKLKISLRRSPKDLLREQAAEAKYAAERKEKEAASSSTNPSGLDGSIANYLEQFGSTVAVEETEQNIVDSNEQVQVVIPTNEPPCDQENVSQIENDQIDSGGVVSSAECVASQVAEPIVVENISTDNTKVVDEVNSETTITEENEIHQNITAEPTTNAVVESINPSEEIAPDSSVLPRVVNEESTVSEHAAEEKTTRVTGVESSGVDIPIGLSEQIPSCTQPEVIETVVNESNVSEVVEDENKSTDDKIISKIGANDTNKPDDINDSEQMEDVVQLTVESPDLVDDEDSAKLVDEEETKSVVEPNPVEVRKPADVEEPKKLIDDEHGSKLVEVEKVIINEPSGESCSTPPPSSDVSHSEQVDDGENEVDEMPNSLSSYPKRKWGSCKIRTPITISPFTLGKIIESNGDSIGDNGEYRSEEGEIQRSDSDEEQQDTEEPMEINDTMLIDHEAVDYEAPEEEEKPDNDDDGKSSEKSLTEETIRVEPKKKSPVKRVVTTNVIRITNLVRPFTVGQLRDLLQRTGKIVPNGFWIDTIKSQCIVEYENEDQAIETVYALNESQWPSTNPKFLKVVFTDKEELNKALNGTHPDRLSKPKESKVEKLRTQVDNHIILREWDRGKLEDMNGEKEDKPIKRRISDDIHVVKDKKFKKDEKESQDKRRKSKTKTPERIPTKSLDELFRKTKTTPTLYWSPLSTEQIAEKEDQRRKHLAEMERSQKTNPNRRRRDLNIHYPRRR